MPRGKTNEENKFEINGMIKDRSSKVDYWLSEDGLLLLNCWARDGDTMATIAQKCDVKYDTLLAWRKKYPIIEQALQTGKEIVDYKVENALLKAALGYTSKEIKVTVGKKIVNGETFQVLKETTTKEVAPNVMACLAWLNNRKFDQWKRNRDKVVEVDPEDQNVSITIIKGPSAALGDNVNNAVNFTPLVEDKDKKEKVPVEEDFMNKPVENTKEIDENDPDYWPDDWEDEDDE